MANPATVTIDFGSTPVASKSFTINDALINSNMAIEAFVVVDSTGDNDQAAHEHAAASWQITTLPAAGSFTLYIECLLDYCWGTFKIRYVYV